MPDLTDFDGELVDDGYPTDAALTLITGWSGTPESLVRDVLEPIFGGYGGVLVTNRTDDFDRAVLDVRLVTGGWSGCEDAIGALHSSSFWVRWWQSSKRGGAYAFEIPVDAWTTPMGDWPRLVSDFDRGAEYVVTVARNLLATHPTSSGADLLRHLEQETT